MVIEVLKLNLLGQSTIVFIGRKCLVNSGFKEKLALGPSKFILI